MKKIFFVAFFMMIFFGCQSQPKNVDQLKQEVLDSACDAVIRADYEKEIEKQRGKLSQDQLRKSLENMKRNIKCA